MISSVCSWIMDVYEQWGGANKSSEGFNCEAHEGYCGAFKASSEARGGDPVSDDSGASDV